MRWWCVGSSRPVCAKSSAPGWIDFTPNAFALLVAGAVLGQDITFEHLCQVADLAEHDGLPALDEVLHSHLLHESEREGEGAHD